MGDYFAHWLRLGEKISAAGARPPKIFCVNWFRTDENGRFIWPGYGENMRVLEWIVGRIAGTHGGVETFLGTMPRFSDLRWDGMNYDPASFDRATALSVSDWKRELDSHDEFFARLGERVPSALRAVRQRIAQRLPR
jgi:phosphoenolpyruvate carboxykinase (GTP)